MARSTWLLKVLTCTALLVVLQSVKCTHHHYRDENKLKRIEEQVTEVMNDFHARCSEILRENVLVPEVRERRKGFRNIPAFRENPDGVRSCTMGMVGVTIGPREQDSRQLLRLICNALNTCGSYYDSSAASRLSFGTISRFNLSRILVLSVVCSYMLSS